MRRIRAFVAHLLSVFLVLGALGCTPWRDERPPELPVQLEGISASSRVVALSRSVGELWLLAGGKLVGATDDALDLEGISQDTASIGSPIRCTKTGKGRHDVDAAIVGNAVGKVFGLPCLVDEAKLVSPISIIVAFTAIAGSLLVGIPLGILSAVKQYSLLDVIPTSMAICLASAPSFWLGLLLMLQFSLKMQWLPSFGVEKPWWWVLPMLTLVASPFPATSKAVP